MATIHDVAQRAGVSPITVSRVINNSGYASQDTRERVEAAVAELGYVPNRLARSLRSKRTHTLALVLTDITNPFFTTVARGVEDTASDAGYTVIFCNTDESESEEKKYLQVLLQQQVDGILLVPARSSSESIDVIQKQHTPVVVLDRRLPPDVDVDTVRCENEVGAYHLVRLLIELGHRQIAILSGPVGVSTAEDRLAGYRRAMAEANLGVSEQFVVYGSFNQASGSELMRDLLAVKPRPTAVFAANNLICIGALQAIQNAGLRVPEDIALVSFDDLPPALLTTPFFTVAAQPAYEMGRRATQLLLARLAKTSPDPCQQIILPTELIVRQSSGQARGFRTMPEHYEENL
jgi:LacI family transcriptional regulator